MYVRVLAANKHMCVCVYVCAFVCMYDKPSVSVYICIYDVCVYVCLHTSNMYKLRRFFVEGKNVIESSF